MGKPSPAHVRMRELLTGMHLLFEEEQKIAGHRIDFVVPTALGPVGVDVNGDRWHRWLKIRECDRVKLNRVFAEENGFVLGVWWSRLQRSPESVEQAVRQAILERSLAWWDWAVPIEELDPAPSRRVRSLEAAG